MCLGTLVVGVSGNLPVDRPWGEVRGPGDVNEE